MSLPLQFALGAILVAIGLNLIFYKTSIKISRLINKHFKNIKNEMERDE